MIVKIIVLIFFVFSYIYWVESSTFTYPNSNKDKISVVNVSYPEFLKINSSSPVEPPLLVGSFNIQTLTKKKFGKPHVMDIVERIIQRFDLILILEIQTFDDYYTQLLLKDLNRYALPEDVYSMVLSDKQSATAEHYAIYYKKNKLKVIASESYDDPSVFYRKPLIAIFEAYTLRDMKKFGVIGQHVKPSQAVQEIDGLAGVYDYVKDRYKTEDVLLMGDFNADCTYVKETDWDSIALWYRSEFTWAISSKTDTTTNYKSCALDRFVYGGEKMNDGIILSSARAFDFQEAFNLNTYETRGISDHWPIELKIRGKLSSVAEKHLTAKVCFNVQDSRQGLNSTLILSINNLAKKAFFNISVTVDGILLSNRTREEEDMFAALDKIRTVIPNLVSHELVEAVKYKVNHGSLRDDSSFADAYDSMHVLNILSARTFVEAFVCKTTTIN